MFKKKLRIGILMDSLKMNNSLSSLILSLEQNENIDIILLHNKLTKKNISQKVSTKISNEGFFRFCSLAFFSILTKLEDIFFRKIDKKYSIDSKIGQVKKSNFLDVLDINPIFYKKFFVKYSENDLEKINDLKLDFIFRGNGSGIFKGGILYASKYGLISLHHGDNKWNRGGPPGFWEVYLSKRKSGFIIQICTEKLDDGKVIFRGETVTMPTYLKNRLNLQQISYPFIEKIFEYVLENGKLPTINNYDTSNSRLFKTPKLTVSLNYVFKILVFYISKIIKRLILNKKQVWQIGVQEKNWKNFDFQKISKLKNPKNRFLADPFIFSKDSLTAIFVEDFSFSENKGSISAILLDEKGDKEPQKIIEEDFHLSFPFVFKYNDKLYMVPESRRDKSIRIYECVDFPYNWRFSHKIMDHIDAVDSIIFYKEPHWWLMANVGDKKSLDVSSRAYLFYSDSPLSMDWKEHKKNPVVFSSDFARNGGLILEDDRIIRVRQKYGFNQYGKQISLSEILTLTPDEFFEKQLKEIIPKFSKKIKGIHHLSSEKSFSVIDFVQDKS